MRHVKKVKGKGKMGKGRIRRYVTVALLCPFTFSLLPFPFLFFPFPTQSLAQQVAQSEIPAPLTARTVSPRFQTLTLEDGLAQGNIHDIFQDSRGFMWFATQGGLNRWDGYEMRVFKQQPFDSTSISSSWVNSVSEDADGFLWIATVEGLNRMDPNTEEFVSWTHDPLDPQSLSDNLVYGVLPASDGSIWVSTSAGLNRMDVEDPGIFQLFEHDPDDPTTLSHPAVFYLYEDSGGRIWAGTPDGLNRIEDQQTGTVRRYFDLEGIPGCGPFGFEDGFAAIGPLERPEEPGIIWVATEGGLARLDPDTGEHEFFDSTTEGCGAFGIVQDPINPGVLWATMAEKGIARFDIRTQSFQIHEQGGTSSSGVPGDASFALYADRSGVIWIGSWPFGVSYFDPTSVGVAHHTSVPDDPNSLGGAQVTSMFLGRDGILWVWSSEIVNATLTALDRANGTAEYYRHDPNNPATVGPGGYWGYVVEDPSGYIWVGTRASGLDRLDPRSGGFTHYRHDPNDPESLPADEVGGMFVDRAGTLWLGHRGTLSRTSTADPGRFQSYVGEEGNDATIFPTLVRGISEDHAGFIWVAQNDGVSRLDPISGRIKRWTHDPSDPRTLGGRSATYVHERRIEPGVVWITSYGGGLDRLDVETGEIRHFTERDGLADGGAYGMLEDERGRLWISTNRGLSRFDPDTETFRNYGMEIGLQGLEFNSGAFHRGFQGEFFFGGQNGLNSFFPNELNENRKPPEVTLVDLKLFNESVAKTGAVELSGSLDKTEQITLRHDQRDLEFDFVAFHYTDPGSNEYAYKLDGWNDDWVYVGTKRTASFTNLDPGEYTFRVKAANSDGVWNEEGASIKIIVTPPFWATWWFRILGLFAFTGVILGGYRLRTAQLESRARELEGEVDARTAQLKASNDQLEQSQSIVKAINQETSFRRLLTKIMEEARIMPGVEKATAIIYMPKEGVFRVRASSGWDVDAMSDITLTDRQARKRYVANSEEVGEDIFVAKNVAEREGSDQMAEFGQVASFLVLRIMVEGDVAGYLVFDNLTDADAFDERDVAFLERLREHIQSAFIKTRILEDLQTTLGSLQSTQDRLVQTEKMASLGELTAGIAHEIKNPLNFVNNFAEVAVELVEEAAQAAQDGSPERVAEILAELKENAERIEHHAKRADGIVENMMQHASGSGRVEPTDINALLDEYVALSYHGFRAKHDDFEIVIEKNLDDSIRKLDVNPQELGKVFQNLLGNAFDALRANGERRMESGEVPTVTVSTSKTDKSGSEEIEIRISDNGPGIPDQVRDKIFEPFFTTKPAGSGTGLGLSMSYDIITKGHGGELEVESEPGKGATFIVRLPA